MNKTGVVISFFMVDVVRPVKLSNNGKGLYHTIENHEFHMRRYGFCPCCNVGSVPKSKSEIIELLGLSRESEV